MKGFVRFLGFALLMLIVGYGTYIIVTHLDKDKSLETGTYRGENGTDYEVYQDLVLRDIVVECHDTKECTVLTEYIYLSGIPKNGCSFAWELCEGDEISYVDSNKGLLDYSTDRNYVITNFDGSDSELQLVLYIKSADLDKSLNSIFVSNENIKVMYGFDVQVFLPDGNKKSTNKNLVEEDYITLKDYFSSVKFED